MWTYLLTLPSSVKKWLMGLGGVIALLSMLQLYIFRQRKDAVKEHVIDEVLKDNKVRDDAKRVGYEEKRDASGLSDSDLSDRLRRRSDDWGSL